MREIKFRYIWQYTPVGKPEPLHLDYYTLDELELESVERVPGNIIGRDEYTGLKDKNEVKIYEGDLVKDSWGDVTEVKWGRMDLDGAHEPTPLCWLPGLEGDGQVEVIGNIYENPELLGTNNEGDNHESIS